MPVNLKNIETERLLHRLSELTGESLTEAATAAFRERLERLEHQRDQVKRRALTSLLDLVAEARAGRVEDPRPLKEIRDELWGEK